MAWRTDENLNEQNTNLKEVIRSRQAGKGTYVLFESDRCKCRKALEANTEPSDYNENTYSLHNYSK